jgi:hypothetical protein
MWPQKQAKDLEIFIGIRGGEFPSRQIKERASVLQSKSQK